MQMLAINKANRSHVRVCVFEYGIRSLVNTIAEQTAAVVVHEYNKKQQQQPKTRNIHNLEQKRFYYFFLFFSFFKGFWVKLATFETRLK